MGPDRQRVTERRTAAAPPGRRPRRTALLALLAALALCADVAAAKPSPAARKKARPAAAKGFGFEDVTARAKKLAGEPFKETKNQVPEWLHTITYDQWRDIRFRPEQTLWKDDNRPFQVQLFHPGLYYDRTVVLNVIDGAKVQKLEFSPSQFDYGRNEFASKVPQKLGYAGFRVHAPIKTPKYYDEVVVFLGASYFRGVGKDQGFGLSARGLAIDTALPAGEEFPYFKEFWLVTPDPKAKSLTIYAVLDSATLTGAYEFVVTPGAETTMNVRARLFPRRPVNKIGIAPLTSMFFHGENTNRTFDDFRPEVHDSDGLLISQGSGEWLWRPIDNPRTLNVSRFRMPTLRGYGLMQRDRDFASYQDLETRAERRPSAWITPHGDWGSGALELVEIPTKSDTNDNIVAYWVPDAQPEKGKPYEVAYTLTWFGDDATKPPGGRVVATRRDHAGTDDLHRFVVDFAGKALDEIPADQVIRGDVSIAGDEDAAEIVDQHVTKNPVTGGWRLTFEVRPKRDAPIELRAFLDRDAETLTETWSYAIVP